MLIYVFYKKHRSSTKFKSINYYLYFYRKDQVENLRVLMLIYIFHKKDQVENLKTLMIDLHFL